jgi:hypothetical protein
MLNHFFFESFPQDDKEYQLCWLGTIRKSSHIENSCVISVYFRELLSQQNKQHFRDLNWKEKEAIIRKFSLDLPSGAIPLLRLGSIWKNGKVTGVTDSEKLILKGVKLNKENCLTTRTNDYYSLGKYYIPRYLYPLNGEAWKTNILVFPNNNLATSTVSHFVLPSAEIFRAEYTNSSNLTELLLYGDWTDSDNGIYNPNKSLFDEENNAHYIQLRQKVLNVDAPLVARFFFSSYAQKCLNHFHNEFKKSLITFKEAGINCLPPFEEEVDLIVHGQTLKTDDREIFLIYWIEQSTSPFPFQNLIFSRDNDSRKVKGADLDSLKTYDRFPKKKIKNNEEEKENKPKPVSTSKEKSKTTSTIWEKYTSNRFSNLEHIDISKKDKGDQTHFGIQQSEIDSTYIYSIEGGGYGVGCLTPLGILETLKLIDPNLQRKNRKEAMPARLDKTKDALLLMAEKNSISVNFIQLFNGMIPDTNYSSFIQGRKSWCFIDGKNKSQRRQILVAELKVNAKSLYLLDLERREKLNVQNNSEKFSIQLIAKKNFDLMEIKDLEGFVDSCTVKESWISEYQIIELRRERVNHAPATVEEFAKNIFKKLCVLTKTDATSIGNDENLPNVIDFPIAA